LILVRAVRARLSIITILGLIAACSRAPAPPSEAAQPPAGATGTSAAPAVRPAVQTIVGPVLETMDAASYTYVRVQSDTGDVWAAAPQFPVKVGDRVVVALEMPMKNFHSQSPTTKG
jgi:hypothetical protein